MLTQNDDRASGLSTQQFLDISNLFQDQMPIFERNFTRSNKPLLPVIGGTGAGKSTWINALLGADLKKRWINGQLKVVNEMPDAGYPVIGHGAISQTFVPCVYEMKDTAWNVGDFPGFDDDRGCTVKIVASVATELALSMMEGIQGVLVVIDFNQLTARRSKGFTELAHTLSHLFRNLSKVEDSFVFAVTKVPNEYPKDQLKDLVQELGKPRMQGASLVSKMSSFVLNSLTEKQLTETERDRMEIGALMAYAFEQGRVHIADVEGDRVASSLESIKASVKAVQPLSFSDFNFKHYDSDRLEFNRCVIQLASEISILQEKEHLPKAIQNLEEEKTTITKGIQDMKNQREAYQSLGHMDATEKDKQVKQLETVNDQEKRLIDQQQAIIDDMTEKIRSHRIELELIDNSDDFEYSEDPFFESRSGFGFYLSWSRHKFEWNLGIPFKCVKKDIHNGALYNEQKDCARGSYSATYKSDWGKEGKATIRVIIANRDAPEHSAKINRFKEEIREYEHKKTEAERSKQVLEDRKDALFLACESLKKGGTQNKLEHKRFFKHLETAIENHKARINQIEERSQQIRAYQPFIEEKIKEKIPLFKMIYFLADGNRPKKSRIQFESTLVETCCSEWKSYLEQQGLKVSIDQDLYICPISMDVMIDPVLTECGHTFDRISLTTCLDEQKAQECELTCPICRDPINLMSLTPQTTLRSAIKQYMEKKGKLIQQQQKMFAGQLSLNEIADHKQTCLKRIRELKKELEIEEAKLQSLQALGFDMERIESQSDVPETVSRVAQLQDQPISKAMNSVGMFRHSPHVVDEQKADHRVDSVLG